MVSQYNQTAIKVSGGSLSSTCLVMMSIMFSEQNVRKALSQRKATKPLAKLLVLYADSILSSQLLWALCVETGQTCEGASLLDLTGNQLFVHLF